MPEPALQATALRYAAGDLNQPEVAAFEERLATDQEARDALSEAVRLSAAALGQSAPKPGDSFRDSLRERLSWTRSRKLVWAATGAGVAAVCALVGLGLADHNASPASPTSADDSALVESQPATPEPDLTPAPHEVTTAVAVDHSPAACGTGEPHRSVAEIWADLSTPEHVEKTRDDEARWRQKMHNLAHPHHTSSVGRFDAP